MANLLSQFGNWNAGVNTKIFGTAEELTKFGKSMGGLGINAENIGGIANTIGQIGTGLLAGQNETGIGNAMQTIGGLASNIPGVGGLIGAGVGVLGGLVNAAFGSHINDEFVAQTENMSRQIGNRIFNSNTNADLLNDWQNTVMQSNVRKSEVGSDGWFSSKASDKTDELNRQIEEANKRQLANFNLAAQNVDAQNDLRILQNMAAYGGPINSFRKYYDKGGYLSQAKALIRQNEGWREKPYNDAPKGKNWRSVGYGFNDSGFREKYPEGISKHYEHGITKKQAEEELDYFLNKAEKQLKSIYGKQWNDFTDSQKAAILDTYYQRPASVGKSSRFYKAITAGEDAGRYLGVSGYNKRNKIRQGVFGGSQDYVNLGAETENPSANSSSLQEVTPFTPVVHDLDLSGITPTEAKALELNLTSPTFDLSMFGKPMTAPTQQAVPTVGTVEDFLASYEDFDENLFEDGGKLNIKDMNIYDFGGWLSHTHGSDFDSGLDFVAEGNSHEQNPFGGVMVGQDGEGTPNLVEEGEYIWNGDYVFSRRMKVPKKLREKYHLKDDATFADAIKVLTKESEERPLDNISRRTQDHILGEFADSQEELRAAKAQRAMEKEQQLQEDFLTGVQFGLGGALFADGGGIHIDPSKRGTFKAQASKMGMGVQEAASHILANKEDYSPEMVKKANFARNSSKWHEDGGFLFDNSFAYGGELGNVFAGEGNRPNILNLDAANQSLVRRIFGDTGFTRFMENTAEAINDPIGYFAGDEINAVIDKLGKMSEPQLERFFRTDIGRAIAPYLAGNDNSQVQESGMRGAKSVANIVRRVQRPVQIAAKKAMAQSRQAARGQMRTPKGGGSQKVLNETMTPTQAARQATTGSTEGLPQGWNFTRGNTSTVTSTSGVTGRLNPKSPTGRAAQSRGTAPDPYAGLEGSMSFGRRTPFEAAAERWGGTPADWKEISLLGGASAIGFPFVANYISDMVHNAMSEESPQANSAVQPTSATSNRGNVNGGTSRSTGNSKTTSQKSGGKPKAASSVTTKPKGATGLNLYDWYRNGSDGISEPTGFKVGSNGRAYDYTNEYRDLVNRLGADDIRAWAAEHPDDQSLKSFLARGNKLEDLTDEQWRKGATDNKYGFMHHVADQIGKEKAAQRAMTDEEFAAEYPMIARPNGEAAPTDWTDGSIWGNTGTAQAIRSGEPTVVNGKFKPRQTWTRQVPIWMSGLMGLKELLTPADYGNADAIMEAAYQSGSPVSVGTEYIGDYRKRDPFDERYLMNIINQRGAATNRNMMNLSGGNRAVAMSGILANDLTTQMSLAEAARQAYLANRADDAQVAEFNRGTNIFNAQAQNTRNLSLAQLNSQRQNAMLSGIAQGARLRQAIKDQRDAAISANLSAFAQGLGDLGKENGYYNMLGGLNEEGVLKYFFGDDWKTRFNSNTERV